MTETEGSFGAGRVSQGLRTPELFDTGRVLRELVVPPATLVVAGLLWIDNPTEHLRAIARPVVATELRSLADLLVIPWRTTADATCYAVDRQTAARTLRTRADELDG